MPLRDHFRPPLDDETQWEGLHGGWPMMIAAQLNRDLPRRYVAAPRVHVGAGAEIDVAAYENDPAGGASPNAGPANGGVATAVWAPPVPTLAVATDLPSLDEYAVRVYDVRRGRRLVAAVEIVSPANKGRPEHRRAFVGKCLALLQQQVCVAVVDLVTTRAFNVYAEMLESIGKADPGLGAEPPELYAACSRTRRDGEAGRLESWAHSLAIGRPLPTLPLWLADECAVPLELEASYEETCRLLRVP